MHTKHFRNKALRAMSFPLVALYGSDNIITSVRPWKNQLVGMNDDQRAEVDRMVTWANTTFVGQTTEFFDAHNGIVPSPQASIADFDFSSDPYARMAEVFGVPYKSVRETTMPKTLGTASRPSGANFYHTSGDADFRIDGVRFVVLDDLNPEAIAEALLATPGALDAILSGMHEEALTGKPQEVNIELRVDTDGATETLDALVKAIRMPPKWAEGIPVRGKPWPYGQALNAVIQPPPEAGSYWQSRTEPTKFYKITDVQPCIGHWHIEMHCLQNGEPEDRVWISNAQWADIFAPVDRVTAHAPLSPQSSVGPHALKLDTEAFLRAPDRASDVEPSSEVVAATQRVLDGVEFTGTEAPPKEGEQYQRVNGDDVFTVKSVVQEDFGLHKVLLENADGSMRVKVAYRNHAQWLSHWRPVDSNGEVKPVVFVDIEIDGVRIPHLFPGTKLNLQNDDKEVIAEVREGMIEENAERWIRIIGRELDRRVPGWRDYDPPGVLYDDCALILRAIRTLNRHMLNYQKLADELAEQNKAQLKMAEHHNKKMSQMTTWLNEMTRDASVSFKNTFGIEKTKELLKEFGYANVLAIPEADRVSWVRKLREYAGRAGVL